MQIWFTVLFYAVVNTYSSVDDPVGIVDVTYK